MGKGKGKKNKKSQEGQQQNASLQAGPSQSQGQEDGRKKIDKKALSNQQTPTHCLQRPGPLGPQPSAQQGTQRSGFAPQPRGGYGDVLQQPPAQNQDTRGALSNQQTPTHCPQRPGPLGPQPSTQQRTQPPGFSPQPRGGRGDVLQQPPAQNQDTRGGAGPSIGASTKELQIVPRREDKGDDNLVSQIKFKPGTKGRVIKVESNHFALNLGTLKAAFYYNVNIDPDKPKKFLRLVMEEFRRKQYPRRYPAFDGQSNMYASSPLTNNLTEILTDNITLVENEREKHFKVVVKYVKEVDLSPLRDLLNHPVTPREAMQCVDIVLRSAPAMRFIPVGRSFFTRPRQIIDLEQGMEMYTGFFQSTVRGWKPLLNVDVAHKAFPKNINVIKALAEVLRFQVTKGLQLEDSEKKNFENFIRDLKVVYMIPDQPGSKRDHRVNGLGEPASSASCEYNGRKMTVEEYFKNIKHVALSYPDLPTLHVGNPQRKILCPMEFCTIKEGQASNKKLTDIQTRNMIRVSATDTGQRKDKIMDGLSKANYNRSETIKEFGFSVGNQFQQLDARVLKPPMLLYRNNQTAKVSKGRWNNQKFLKAVTIRKWTIRTVGASRRFQPDNLRNMVNELQKAASNCGIQFDSKPDEPFDNIRPDLQTLIRNFKGLKDKKYDVIFVVIFNSKDYSKVKTAAEINVGCLTQCVKEFTVCKKMDAATAGNILLKVNAKLTGTNHSLAEKPPILQGQVMIMGADVTHPGPGSTTIPSVAAVTASHDREAFQYNICWRLQPPKLEIITDLEQIVVEQLNFFKKKNNCYPEVILFFRDGVSEGQFYKVKHEEVSAIKRACKRMSKDGYTPKITFLVVQKRHHTRLFPKNLNDSEDKGCNVPAGTCVDTEITHPFMQDFYLVSHASIRGVARPTKYCTLLDENEMSNDDIEQLTYYLCHMFTRCNRSVSYPAPTYYAHLAAARGKVYIEHVKLDLSQLDREFKKYTIKNEIRQDLPMFFV